MTPELRAALDDAYKVFALYGDPLNIPVQCHIARSMRQLTCEDWNRMDDEFDIELQFYSDLDLFRHYLPRLLEWTCSGEYFDERLMYPLVSAHWRDWPEQEVKALRRVFEVWTCHSLAKWGIPLDFLLEVEDRYEPYLNPWVRARPLEVATWIEGQSWLRPKSAILRWVLQPIVEAKLEAAFWANPGGEHAGLFSRVLQLLGSVRALKFVE